jgi:hypothetical protein
MTQAWEETSDFVQDLAQAARRNPLAAALIGGGVLWLFGGRAVQAASSVASYSLQDGERADVAPVETRSALKAGARAAGDNVAAATSKLQSGASAAFDEARRFGREQADTVGEYAREYARSVPETGAEMFGSLRSNLADVMERQPLALGVIGLLLGAGIAAALPPTALETDYLGESSEMVKEKAAQFASEKAARARTIAEEALNAATGEARRQGLTVEGAKTAAGEVSEKVSRVAEAARKGMSERTGANRS